MSTLATEEEAAPEAKIITATYLDKSVHDRLKECAKEEDRAIASLLRLIITEYLEERGR